MARPRSKSPSYRLHKPTGQAVVTLADPDTGARRDHYLGKHGTPESHHRYAELLQQYQSDGRVVDAKPKIRRPAVASDTVGGLLLDYWKSEKERFGVKEGQRLKSPLPATQSALRTCRRVCGRLPVAEFSPKHLQAVREAFCERKLKRRTVNTYTRFIIAAFKWGVAEERVNPEVVTSLQCVRPYRHGEKSLGEGRKVKPAPEEMIEAIKPHVSEQVWAIIQLQLLSGARQGELVTLRACEIDRTDKVWRYRPEFHKNTRREREREINFGPRAQAILKPFIDSRPDDAFLFSPKEAEVARRAKQRSRRTSHPSANKTRDAKRQAEGKAAGSRAGDCYKSGTYAKAIRRACDRVWPPPEQLEGDALQAWKHQNHWTPHQLRHNAATRISKHYNLIRAQIALDHSSAELTDAVYAERDRELIDETMMELG